MTVQSDPLSNAKGCSLKMGGGGLRMKFVHRAIRSSELVP